MIWTYFQYENDHFFIFENISQFFHLQSKNLIQSHFVQKASSCLKSINKSSLESCKVDPGDGFQYLSSYQNVYRWKNRDRWKKFQNYFFLTNFLKSYFKALPEKLIFSQKHKFFEFFIWDNEIMWIHVHRFVMCTLDAMASSGTKYTIFWPISVWCLPPRTFWAWKKPPFLSFLLILRANGVAFCCLNIELPTPFHKHTSELSIALSPISIELLDRFLEKKTWFFVFSKSHARFVAKGLKRCESRPSSFHWNPSCLYSWQRHTISSYFNRRELSFAASAQSVCPGSAVGSKSNWRVYNFC